MDFGMGEEMALGECTEYLLREVDLKETEKI